MTTPNETLATLIDNLARQTGAPEAFVEKTRLAFESRDISLDTQAQPHFMLLVDTFRREESSRQSRERSLEGLRQLQGKVAQWQAQQTQMIEKLRALAQQLERRDGAAG